VFTDRGVYRLGEQVHVKAILRSDTNRGIQLLPAGTPVYVTLRDSQYPRSRDSNYSAQRMEQCRLDDERSGGRLVGQLLSASSARAATSGSDGSGQSGGSAEFSRAVNGGFWWRHIGGPTSALTRP
jgi:hypothetical protein